jgi:hypothetical protein
MEIRLILLLSVFLIYNVHSAPKGSGDQEGFDAVDRLTEVLEKNKEVNIFLIDDWETKKWNSKQEGFLNATELKDYVPQIDSFEKDKLLLQQTKENKTFQKSLEWITYWERGFLNHAFLYPIKQIVLPKKWPVAFAIHVHSRNYPFQLKVRIKNIRNQELVYKVADLNFDGWKRFEIRLRGPLHIQEWEWRKSRTSKIISIELERIDRKYQGEVILHLDEAYAIMDGGKEFFPGKEILDDWSSQ